MSNNHESDTNSENEREDDERTAIRAELSALSFEDLQKLKERIGAKVYKEALFGKNVKTDHTKMKTFKRENKNRPREISSKIPVPILQHVAPVKNKEIRDPRFDPLCGEFNRKEFSQNYNFLSELRIQDIKAIKAELKQTDDPEREKQLRRLKQRLNDQHKSSQRDRIEKETLKTRKREVEQQYEQGRMPQFKKKSELRVESLVKQYEELKKEGTSRIRRHLKRRQQKVKKRSHHAPTGVL